MEMNYVAPELEVLEVMVECGFISNDEELANLKDVLLKILDKVEEI